MLIHKLLWIVSAYFNGSEFVSYEELTKAYAGKE